jgi:predicted lipoprotein with Yx(FWY)xxD motif
MISSDFLLALEGGDTGLVALPVPVLELLVGAGDLLLVARNLSSVRFMPAVVAEAVTASAIPALAAGLPLALTAAAAAATAFVSTGANNGAETKVGVIFFFFTTGTDTTTGCAEPLAADFPAAEEEEEVEVSAGAFEASPAVVLVLMEAPISAAAAAE